MCSYQNIDSNQSSLSNENWEEELWANILSPTPNESTVCRDYQHPDTSLEVASSGNEISSTAHQNYQVQVSTVYQNVESSSLLSPAWEDTSTFEVPQSMSTYFSTFNPSTQFQETPIHQRPITMVRTQSTPANRKMHCARINLVPCENGTFKAIVKRKRKRTVFTTEQLEMLEEVFTKKPYVTREERQVLVKKLQVNDKSVKVWFQNRRLKNKRGDQYEVMETENNSTIFDRLDKVESKINERTDEFGYVTLDDKIVNDLVNVIDDYFSNKISQIETKTDIDRSPIYEPISPASTSDYSCEESTSWQHYEPNDTVQNLMDIESIIST